MSLKTFVHKIKIILEYRLNILTVTPYIHTHESFSIIIMTEVISARWEIFVLHLQCILKNQLAHCDKIIHAWSTPIIMTSYSW